MKNQPIGKLEFLIAKRPEWSRGLRLYMRVVDRGRSFLGRNVVFEEQNEDARIEAEPVLTLDPEVAVQLMDELWRAGVRPTEVGTGGQLDAVRYHLEDMRRIVFSSAVRREDAQ